MSDQMPLPHEVNIERFKHQLAMEKLKQEHTYELEKTRNEEWFKARQEYARLAHAERLLLFGSFKEYGQQTLRALFIANAGAIIAILTLVGSAMSKPEAQVKLLPALFVSAFWKIGRAHV